MSSAAAAAVTPSRGRVSVRADGTDRPLPDDGAADPIELGALFRCLGRLEERARQVVTLSFQQRKPTDEVAARLALTPGNVRVIRHRAIAALRRCLDAAEES